jgi:hypothetical protein
MLYRQLTLILYCWINKVTKTPSKHITRNVFHDNDGYMNAHKSYVLRTSTVLSNIRNVVI